MENIVAVAAAAAKVKERSSHRRRRRRRKRKAEAVGGNDLRPMAYAPMAILEEQETLLD